MIILSRGENDVVFVITGQACIYANQEVTEHFNDRWFKSTDVIIETMFNVYERPVEKIKTQMLSTTTDEILGLCIWPPTSKFCQRTETKNGTKLERHVDIGGINGSTNNGKFYNSTCFHLALEESIGDLAKEQDVTYPGHLENCSGEVKVKSLLGAIVMEKLKTMDDCLTPDTDFYNIIGTRYTEEIYCDYRKFLKRSLLLVSRHTTKEPSEGGPKKHNHRPMTTP